MSGMVFNRFTKSYLFGESYENLVYRTIHEKLGSNLSLAYGHPVGRMGPITKRLILIRLHDYCDKAELLACANNSLYSFENRVVKYENAIQKLHS